jgi:hypothetical protein
LILRGVISLSLPIHGGFGLDRVGGHTRAPTKPCESGVYDSGGVGYLSYVRESYVPCSSGGIRRGVCGALGVRIWCVIVAISPLSAAVLWPGAALLDPLGDLAYGGFCDPV